MKTRFYNHFCQSLLKNAKEKGILLRVMFELTYRCNFRCKHCYIPHKYKKYKELKTKEVFLILDQLKKLGCFYLGFTGGEPFLRNDIIDILWYAKRRGFEIIIYTNGSLINDRICVQLAGLRPNKIDITIPAMDRVSFKRITQVAGFRDKVFRAIKLLHKKGINLGFKSCLLKENEDEIRDIQDFAASLGAQHRLDNLLFPRLDGSKEPYLYRGKFKESDIKDASLRPRNIDKSKVIDCNLELRNLGNKNHSLFKCGVGVSQAAITPLGELKMCLMIDYPKYKILESSLVSVWDKLKELARNTRPDKNYKCYKCNLRLFCKWCPARGWLFAKSFSSCEPEVRSGAQQIKVRYEDRI